MPKRVADLGKVLTALERAAATGAPCPSNLAIAELLGSPSPGTGARMLQLLEKAGSIKVERGPKSRVATIIATGKRTGGTIANKHWSERGVVKSAAQPRAVPASRVEPSPATKPLYRDACPFCAVRADIGCSHLERLAEDQRAVALLTEARK